jgi:hypothetical protein
MEGKENILALKNKDEKKFYPIYHTKVEYLALPF